MPVGDRVCAIMFDGMSTMAALQFNPSTGNVDGLSDLGNGRRVPEVAEHIVSFTVQGLRRQYKLPFAYYPVKRTIRHGAIGRMRVGAIAAVQSTGQVPLFNL